MTDYNAIRGAARRVLPVVLGVGALAAPAATQGATSDRTPTALASRSGIRITAKTAVGTGYRFGVYGTPPRHADIVLQGKWRNGPWRYWGRTSDSVGNGRWSLS